MRSSTSWLTIFLTALVGILMIVWHSRLDILSWIVIAVGLMFIIPGIYNLISGFVEKRDCGDGTQCRRATGSSVVASIGCIAFGVWMVVQPGFFVGLIAYLFAAVLILYGIYEIVLMAWLSKPFAMPFGFYIIPVVLIGAGVVILCTTVRTMNSVVVLLTGILLVSAALNWALQRMLVTSPSRRRGNAA